MPVVVKLRPTSASRSSPSNSETPTFCLSGSQVNLTPRVNSNAGKASVRSSCVSVKRKRRPMSAVPLLSQQSTKTESRKQRPMSADLEKYMSQRHSLDSTSLEQPWHLFDQFSFNMLQQTEVKFVTSENTWDLQESVAPENSDNLETQTDALLDQLLESTVQHTKKQLRFAHNESDLLNLSLPSDLITTDFSNPEENFVGDLVDDIKCKVKDSFSIEKAVATRDNNKQEETEAQKQLVQQLLLNNNSHHNEDVTEQSTVRKNNFKKQKLRKPKTIAELLEIIDSEIPIQFRRKPMPPPKPKLKSLIDLPNHVDEISVLPLKPEILTLDYATENQDVVKKENVVQKEEDVCASQESEVKVAEQTQVEQPVVSSQGHSLSDILNFLDHVEKSDDISRSCSRIDKSRPLDTSLDTVMTGGGTQRQIRALKESLEERAAHVHLLKETLMQARVDASDTLAAAHKEHQVAKRKQKAEYEATLKKLQDGIDKLLEDKKQLVQKVEELIQQLRNVESKHQTSVHALQQRHTVEIARTKQLAAAAEKIRRERWVERQTARIKELTVKGLEPELTRLSLQHENKVSQLQAVHSREMQSQVEAEARRTEELRALMTRDKDEELARERTLMTERFERQLCEERAMLELRCERLKEEHATEVSRLQAAWTTLRENLESQARQEATRVQLVHEQHIAQMEEKKQMEIHAAHDAMHSEQQAWLTAQTRKNSDLLAAKQQELREERDREIERAIEKLECEGRREREEQERETEKKLIRLREQHEAVLCDRDLSERLLQARLSDAQNSMQASEEQLLAARAAESRLKQELCISEQRVEALESDHATVREKVSQQFAAKIQELELCIEQLKRDRDTELEQVHSRLKGVLEKKDQLIQQLRAQDSELAKRCRHLESLLGQTP